MFTGRFITVQVQLYNREESDIIGYTESTKGECTGMRINPFEISHYRPGYDEQFNQTLVHMKNGDSFYISLNTDDFEKVLNKIT